MKKFRQQHNGTILSLQYYKLSRLPEETAEEWMAILRLKATEYKYKENDRYLKEQLINGISDEFMTEESIKELLSDNAKEKSEQVLIWAKGWKQKRILHHKQSKIQT